MTKIRKERPCGTPSSNKHAPVIHKALVLFNKQQQSRTAQFQHNCVLTVPMKCCHESLANPRHHGTSCSENNSIQCLVGNNYFVIGGATSHPVGHKQQYGEPYCSAGTAEICLSPQYLNRHVVTNAQSVAALCEHTLPEAMISCFEAAMVRSTALCLNALKPCNKSGASTQACMETLQIGPNQSAKSI